MTSVSKSAVRAAGCPLYLQKGRDTALPHPLGRIGREFHAYKDAYVQHLVDIGEIEDPQWARDWLSAAGFLDETVRMVEWDIETFAVDPLLVVGVEKFLAVDGFFQPLDLEFPGYGKEPDDPNAILHGTVDLIQLDDGTITIDDYKTGYHPKVDEYEATHYAVLAFAHFPQADAVVFRWVQVRRGITEDRVFYRSDLERIQRIALNARERTIRAATCDDPQPDPFAGMCAYCALECPVRRAGIPGFPLQTADDARKALAWVEANKHRLSDAQGSARSFLAEAGEVDLGDGRTARIEVKESDEFILPTALRALDIDCPDYVEEWDLDLTKLRIGATELGRLLKAKKRAGLRELLKPAVKRRAEVVVSETPAEPQAGPAETPVAPGSPARPV